MAFQITGSWTTEWQLQLQLFLLFFLSHSLLMAQLSLYVSQFEREKTWNTTSYDFDWHSKRKRRTLTYQKFKKPSVRCFTSDLCKREKRRKRERKKRKVLAIVNRKEKKEPIEESIKATVEYVFFPMVVSVLFNCALHIYTYTVTLKNRKEEEEEEKITDRKWDKVRGEVKYTNIDYGVYKLWPRNKKKQE